MQHRVPDGNASNVSGEADASREASGTKDVGERAKQAALSGACEEAIGLYDRALDALLREGPSAELADVLRWKGSVHSECGDTSEADRLYRESGAVAFAARYLGGQAHALNCRATIAQRRGELAIAEALYYQASDLAMEANDIRLAAMTLRNLGVVASTRGHLELAIVRFLESYEKAREIADEDGQCRALNNIATAYMEGGRYADAELTYTSAIKLARKRGDRAVECGCRINLCEAMVGSGKLADAEVECMAALGIADWRGDRVRRAEGLRVLAIIARLRGSDNEAESLINHAIDLTRDGEDVLLAAQLRVEKGEIYRMRKSDSRAASYYREAREIYSRVGASGKVAALDRMIAGLKVPRTSPAPLADRPSAESSGPSIA